MIEAKHISINFLSKISRNNIRYYDLKLHKSGAVYQLLMLYVVLKVTLAHRHTQYRAVNVSCLVDHAYPRPQVTHGIYQLSHIYNLVGEIYSLLQRFPTS